MLYRIGLTEYLDLNTFKIIEYEISWLGIINRIIEDYVK